MRHDPAGAAIVIMLRSLKMRHAEGVLAARRMAQAVQDLHEQGSPAFEAAMPILSQFLKAENAVARYIDGFYNPVRRHSSLGFQSPIAFERKAREVS